MFSTTCASSLDGQASITPASTDLTPTAFRSPDLHSKRSALYFRVSSNRQTTENQFEDLLQVAEREDSGRDWARIRALLAKAVEEEQRQTQSGIHRVTYRVNPEIARQLSDACVYVEQGMSGSKTAKQRPLFEQMKRDAAQRKFDRLLVWKASRLGRDMRQVINTVYELADLGITVVPLKSATGPITSSMGRLLWSIQAWFAEMENDERSEAIKAGHVRAKAEGRAIGRPRVVLRRDELVALRQQGLSWSRIAARTGLRVSTIRRACRDYANASGACQNSHAEGVR